MEQKKTTGHSLTLCDREKLTLTGVTDVDAFNEEEITVITDFGELTVKGELLHVEALDLECGSMQITGKVTALLYTQHREGGGLFGRLWIFYAGHADRALVGTPGEALGGQTQSSAKKTENPARKSKKTIAIPL